VKALRTIPHREFILSLGLACLIVGTGSVAILSIHTASPVVTAPTFQGFMIDPAMFGGVRDEVHLESNTCELHHVSMQPTVVPIAYGLLEYVADGSLREEEVARKGHFPHYRLFFWGGCGGDRRWHSVRTNICPACEQAWKEWNSQRKARQPHGTPL